MDDEVPEGGEQGGAAVDAPAADAGMDAAGGRARRASLQPLQQRQKRPQARANRAGRCLLHCCVEDPDKPVRNSEWQSAINKVSEKVSFSDSLSKCTRRTSDRRPFRRAA